MLHPAEYHASGRFSTRSVDDFTSSTGSRQFGGLLRCALLALQPRRDISRNSSAHSKCGYTAKILVKLSEQVSQLILTLKRFRAIP